MSLTREEIQAVRQKLNLGTDDFARLLSVDERSVVRWEAGTVRPVGSADALICALHEVLQRYPDRRPALSEYLRAASRVGGMAYVLIRAMEEMFTERTAAAA
jgi:DNA-binding XRE family transcriptional regulator